jgi:hypothetical protein
MIKNCPNLRDVIYGRPLNVVDEIETWFPEESLERPELHHVQDDQDDGGDGHEERDDADDVACYKITVYYIITFNAVYNNYQQKNAIKYTSNILFQN